MRAIRRRKRIGLRKTHIIARLVFPLARLRGLLDLEVFICK